MPSALRRAAASRPATPLVAPPLVTAALLGVALLAPSPGRAQLATFTSRAAFAAAAGPVATETFDRPFELVPAAGGAFAIAGGTLTFDANHGGQTVGGGDAFVDLHPAAGGAPQVLRFTFAAPTTAFGADFSLFDVPGTLLRATVGGTTFDLGEGFFGVVAAAPFTELTIGDPTAETFFVLDDVTVGVSAVPEPGTAWLLLAGLAAGGAAARARRRPRAARLVVEAPTPSSASRRRSHAQ